MSAKIIDGTAIAAAVRADVAAEVARDVAAGHRPPHLTVVIAGDDPASHVYVRGKARACAEVGMTNETIELPASVTHAEVVDVVRRLNADDGVDGVLVQMPLPPQVDAQVVMAMLDPAKDADGLSPFSLGRLLQGDAPMPPCTPSGIVEMLRRSGIDPRGTRVVIVNRSMLVGRPLAMLLSNRGAGANATVTIAHTGTRDLPSVMREAEILITGMGQARTVTADMIRPGAVVVDVSVVRIPDATKQTGTRLVGDVDFEAALEVASWITPVPGGVGPMTIAMLMKNTLTAARARRGAR
ncbi:MAG: bifunctional 5,10-methylenetetrahydrofolate dehydrogenase/5,10-methenyltetrahydrofolate cyclohydrolase [Dehalococcoidia bacterium]|nr:MAG: bifunctional 5,10-methylenetetrahydrofolate dehydrogenase/5,10-methenyltetrahydrofolate cyclohydrolase [Dehalococcoidia bacterium]